MLTEEMGKGVGEVVTIYACEKVACKVSTGRVAFREPWPSLRVETAHGRL